MDERSIKEQKTIPPFNPLIHPLVGTHADHTYDNLYCMLTLLTRIFEDRARQIEALKIRRMHRGRLTTSSFSPAPFSAEEERGLSLLCELLQHTMSAAISQCEVHPKV